MTSPTALSHRHWGCPDRDVNVRVVIEEKGSRASQTVMQRLDHC
ncbi:hypothetical protein ABC733_01070 [Mangrovibacter sp. SLW1]